MELRKKANQIKYNKKWNLEYFTEYLAEILDMVQYHYFYANRKLCDKRKKYWVFSFLSSFIKKLKEI